MNKQKQYSLELKTKAMGLWADGKTFGEIAQALGINSARTVEGWKASNYPESWDSYAELLRKMTVEKFRNQHLERVVKTHIWQLTQCERLSEAMLLLITTMAYAGTMSDRVAADIFFKASDLISERILSLRFARTGDRRRS